MNKIILKYQLTLLKRGSSNLQKVVKKSQSRSFVEAMNECDDVNTNVTPSDTKSRPGSKASCTVTVALASIYRGVHIFLAHKHISQTSNLP